MAFSRGTFAQSLAGRDRGCWYVVLESTAERVIVSDGRLHPVEHPKKKNPRHLQPDHRDSGVFRAGASEHPAEQNAAIRNAIKNLKRS